MEESSSSEEEEEEEHEKPSEAVANTAVPSGCPPPPPVEISGTETPAVLDLRKSTGEETPLITGGPKQLYAVLQETEADKDAQKGSVFTSDVAYVLPGEGAESVLSKVPPKEDSTKRKRQIEDEDDADLEKKFKF